MDFQTWPFALEEIFYISQVSQFPPPLYKNLSLWKIFFIASYFILKFLILISHFASQTVGLEKKKKERKKKKNVIGKNKKPIHLMKLHCPQRVFKGRGGPKRMATLLVLFSAWFYFCFVLFLKISLWMALSWFCEAPPQHCVPRGARFPTEFAGSPAYPLHQLVGITHPLRHCKKEQAACPLLVYSLF